LRPGPRRAEGPAPEDATISLMTEDADRVLEDLRAHGYRVTRQRRAIVAEIMRTSGHISPGAVAERVAKRHPGVNPSTVYRTLDLLEVIGVVRHAHLEDGARYHHSARHDHVHLICSRCGRAETMTAAATQPLQEIVERHNGFAPDFTHFAVAGVCARCRRDEPAARRGERRPETGRRH
jgi:Fur family ferric uptake transcriptional regulator